VFGHWWFMVGGAYVAPAFVGAITAVVLNGVFWKAMTKANSPQPPVGQMGAGLGRATAVHIAVAESLIAGCSRSIVERKAAEFHDIIKIGRIHLQGYGTQPSGSGISGYRTRSVLLLRDDSTQRNLGPTSRTRMPISRCSRREVRPRGPHRFSQAGPGRPNPAKTRPGDRQPIALAVCQVDTCSEAQDAASHNP